MRTFGRLHQVCHFELEYSQRILEGVRDARDGAQGCGEGP